MNVLMVVVFVFIEEMVCCSCWVILRRGLFGAVVVVMYFRDFARDGRVRRVGRVRMVSRDMVATIE